MRALITGSCGFVGQYLVRHLVECGDEVIAGVMNEAADLPVRKIRLDVTDADRCHDVVREHKPEVIFHLAGMAFVPDAEDNFNAALLINVGGTNNIYRACHLQQSGTTVVYVSSAEVYGRITAGDLPLTEESPVRPANNYSLSKIMGEMVARRYEQFGHVRSVIVRPFNHIGPGQDKRFVTSTFADQLARIARGEAPPVLRVGNLKAKRDFSDVRDIVRAYRLAALKGSGVYNLGSGRSTEIEELLKTLIAIAGTEVAIEHDPARMRAAEVPEVYGDISKAKRELGWEPRLDLGTSLRDIYQSWLSGCTS